MRGFFFVRPQYLNVSPFGSALLRKEIVPFERPDWNSVKSLTVSLVPFRRPTLLGTLPFSGAQALMRYCLLGRAINAQTPSLFRRLCFLLQPFFPPFFQKSFLVITRFAVSPTNLSLLAVGGLSPSLPNHFSCPSNPPPVHPPFIFPLGKLIPFYLIVSMSRDLRLSVSPRMRALVLLNIMFPIPIGLSGPARRCFSDKLPCCGFFPLSPINLLAFFPNATFVQFCPLPLSQRRLFLPTTKRRDLVFALSFLVTASGFLTMSRPSIRES